MKKTVGDLLDFIQKTGVSRDVPIEIGVLAEDFSHIPADEVEFDIGKDQEGDILSIMEITS